MSETSPGDITVLLRDACRHGREGVERLLRRVYDELHTIAVRRMTRERHRTLEATELLSEAYMRLFATDREWRCSKEFFGAAKRAMDECLVDRARRRSAQKRAGGVGILRLEHDVAVSPAVTAEEMASMHEEMEMLSVALERLARFHRRQHRVLVHRVFEGLDIETTALRLGLSRTTVITDLRFARAFLAEEVFPHGC